MKHIIPIAAVAVALIGVAVLAAVEHNDASLWNSRLLWPAFTPEPNRHTPVFPEGTFLPPTISGSQTLAAKDNPIILAGNVTVPAQNSLVFTEGAHIYTHEFATLTIEGELDIRGSKDQPVSFTTNELHELNQTWDGITITEGGRASIRNAEIFHASAAISCLSRSRAIIEDTEITFSSMGVYTESENCALRNVSMSHVVDGIVAKGVPANALNTTISASRREITEILP